MTAPRTRGSTAHDTGTAGRMEDCPAHAGIDPKFQGLYFSDDGLPRARGDRPGHRDCGVEPVGTAPRTRGSTLAVSSPPYNIGDCPAHAGIDLQKSCLQCDIS